jgi:FkbH-like protein
MSAFSELKKNLSKDYSSLPIVKLALLGDTSTQLLKQGLRGAGFNDGFDMQIWEAEFNQIEQQVFDQNSELYAFEPEIIVLFQSSHKLLDKYNKLGPEQYEYTADRQLLLIDNIVTAISTYSNAKIILYNFNEIDDAIFGNFSNKVKQSFLYQLRRLNFLLMEYALPKNNLYICDLCSIQNQVGKESLFQPSIYITTDMVLSLDGLPKIAAQTLKIVSAIYGRLKKCVIVDLDNTLWGGIIGDDGIENIQIGDLGIGKAFSEFQYWLKKLKNRGIILAVCSKNTESVAKEVFEVHPDMVLKLEDFAVFIANWENKVDNIKVIQTTLNIHFDAIVFLDDNPFERNLVREAIDGITVPELPEDPANYLEYLYGLNLFETISFTNEDVDRTKFYRTEAIRTKALTSFRNEEDFLQNLNMLAKVESFTKFNSPRVAQLMQRSNQFNLRTIRYTEEEILQMMERKDIFPFVFSLSDKFGDNGLISVIILKQESGKILFIDSWLMSCRVLKRGVEEFALNTIVAYAHSKGVSQLKGEYLPTSKNELVKDHFEKLGFKSEGQYWVLDVHDFKIKKTFIS